MHVLRPQHRRPAGDTTHKQHAGHGCNNQSLSVNALLAYTVCVECQGRPRPFVSAMLEDRGWGRGRG